jgi:hypothetical protein
MSSGEINLQMPKSFERISFFVSTRSIKFAIILTKSINNCGYFSERSIKICSGFRSVILSIWRNYRIDSLGPSPSLYKSWNIW